MPIGQERLGWREASDLAAACFLVSYSVPPPGLKASWFARASDAEKSVYRHWHAVASLRCSQTGGDSCCWFLSMLTARLYGSPYMLPSFF